MNRKKETDEEAVAASGLQRNVVDVDELALLHETTPITREELGLPSIDDASVEPPKPEFVQIIDSDETTCASSVTNGFLDAELFMGPMYPSLQNVNEVLQHRRRNSSLNASKQFSISKLAAVVEEEEDRTVGGENSSVAASLTSGGQSKVGSVATNKMNNTTTLFAKDDTKIPPGESTNSEIHQGRSSVAASTSAAEAAETDAKKSEPQHTQQQPHSSSVAGIPGSHRVGGSSLDNLPAKYQPPPKEALNNDASVGIPGAHPSSGTLSQLPAKYQPPSKESLTSDDKKSAAATLPGAVQATSEGDIGATTLSQLPSKYQPPPKEDSLQYPAKDRRGATMEPSNQHQSTRIATHNQSSPGADDFAAEIEPLPASGNDASSSTTTRVPGAYGVNSAAPFHGWHQHPSGDMPDCLRNNNGADNNSTRSSTFKDDSSGGILVRAREVSPFDEVDKLSNDILPIATPEDKLTREGKPPKGYFLQKSIVVVVIAISIVAVIGGVCGSGLCTSGGESVEEDEMVVTAAPTFFRSTLIPEYQDRIQEVFGENHFDDNYTSTADNVHLRALDWIVLEDPLQLEPDADNLVQRYTLAVFYYQTTQNNPWTYCNPPTGTQRDSCVASDDFNENVYADRWLSRSHECFWLGIICEGQGNDNVTDIRLRVNGLHGPIPEGLTALRYLTSLDLHGNQVTGTIPSSLGMLPLSNLDLAHNRMEGTIPEVILSAQQNLTYLNLRNNSLMGTIPSVINQARLQRLYLSLNGLTGTIPIDVFQLTSLIELVLGSNQLTGTIPTQVGNLSSLDSLVLEKNNLVGSLPSEIGLLPSRALVLCGNMLNGTIPEDLYQVSTLTEIDFADCAFSGTISTYIGRLSSLALFAVANNGLHGTIPTELEQLPELYHIALNGNNLTGTFPEEACISHMEGAYGALVVLATDCAPDIETGLAAVTCSCCTECCEAKTGVCIEM